MAEVEEGDNPVEVAKKLNAELHKMLDGINNQD
jgi:hypothetical protein